MRIGLMRLGTRGASPLFARKTHTLLEQAGYSVKLYTLESLLELTPYPKMWFKIFTFKIFLFFPILRSYFVDKLMRAMITDQVNVVVFVFPHPWDFSLVKKIATLRPAVKVVRIIHDFEKHPGDYWPSSKWIEKSLEVDELIALSSFVRNQVVSKFPSVIGGAHPAFPILENSESKLGDLSPLSFSYDIIIGRNRKYQNVYWTAKKWSQLTSLASHRQLVIAGKLGPVLRFNLNRLNNVKVLDEKINDESFQNLVSHADKVICWYTESSQSGVVAMAQTLGTPVVVSNVGGLPEQINSFGGGFVLEKFDEIFELNYSDMAPCNTKKMDEMYLQSLLKAFYNP